jgi:uncharacterized protein (DUF4415 family)
MSKSKDHATSRPDADNPQWTHEEIRTASPALEAMGELFGPQAAESIRRHSCRPSEPDRKVNQTLPLDPDEMEADRREGAGWLDLHKSGAA